MIQPEVQGQNCLYVGCYHSRCNAVVSSDAMDEFLRRMQCDNLPLHCSVSYGVISSVRLHPGRCWSSLGVLG